MLTSILNPSAESVTLLATSILIGLVFFIVKVGNFLTKARSKAMIYSAFLAMIISIVFLLWKGVNLWFTMPVLLAIPFFMGYITERRVGFIANLGAFFVCIFAVTLGVLSYEFLRIFPLFLTLTFLVAYATGVKK